MGPAAGLACAACVLPGSSLPAVLLLGLLAGAEPPSAGGHSAGGHPAGACAQGAASDPAVREIIWQVFGARHARAAIRIAWCESGGLGTRASRGELRGLFQMDRAARRRHGDGPCAEEQVRAAHRYFLRSGRRWTAWASCAR